MYCPTCRCTYPEWLRSCPPCGAELEPAPPVETPQECVLGYDELVARLVAAGGMIEVELAATNVGMERSWLPFYRGYGHAWAARLRGRSDDMVVDLRTSEVGRHRVAAFLHYIGYGFAWTKRLEGLICGNAAYLDASKVEMRRRTRFPYRGYGFAWTQAMSGRCGEQIALMLETTDVARRQRYQFPYQGYGFAWIRRARLTLSVA